MRDVKTKILRRKVSRPRTKFGSKSSGARVKALIDFETGMNKTETAFSRYLDIILLAGEIIEWRFEPIKLRLANATFYTPDFVVVLPDQSIEMIDVKGRVGSGPGGWEEDARVKIKVAAETYPWFHFVGMAKSKTGWIREDF